MPNSFFANYNRFSLFTIASKIKSVTLALADDRMSYITLIANSIKYNYNTVINYD